MFYGPLSLFFSLPTYVYNVAVFHQFTLLRRPKMLVWEEGFFFLKKQLLGKYIFLRGYLILLEKFQNLYLGIRIIMAASKVKETILA